MIKKVISLLLCFVMCVPMVCMANAAEPETAVTEEKKVYTLSLDDAIELALKDNDQLAVCDYQKESYKYSLESAKITRKNNKNAVIFASSGYELGYVKEGYYVDLFETQMNLSDLNKEKTKANITYNVINAYYNYKLMENLVKISKDTYDMVVANKTNVDKLSELGMISAIEVQNAQLAVDSALNGLMSVERNTATVKENLKIALNIEEDCDFVLTSEIDIPEFSADLATDTANAMTTRSDVTSLNENLRLAESHCKLTEKFATKNTAAYYSDLSTYMQTKYTTETSLKQIKLLIKSSYDAVLTARDQITIAQQNVEIQNALYEAAKVKFEMGMITNLDLTTAVNDYSTAEEELEQAKLTYLLAVKKYNYDITIGL